MVCSRCLNGYNSHGKPRYYAMNPESTLRQKAQQGKELIKDSITDLLAHKGQWLRRSEIEANLGLGSTYGNKSYDGALASMLLDELVKEGKISSQRDADGRTWLYRFPSSHPTTNSQSQPS